MLNNAVDFIRCTFSCICCIPVYFFVYIMQVKTMHILERIEIYKQKVISQKIMKDQINFNSESYF